MMKHALVNDIDPEEILEFLGQTIVLRGSLLLHWGAWRLKLLGWLHWLGSNLALEAILVIMDGLAIVTRASRGQLDRRLRAIELNMQVTE